MKILSKNKNTLLLWPNLICFVLTSIVCLLTLTRIGMFREQFGLKALFSLIIGLVSPHLVLRENALNKYNPYAFLIFLVLCITFAIEVYFKVSTNHWLREESVNGGQGDYSYLDLLRTAPIQGRQEIKQFTILGDTKNVLYQPPSSCYAHALEVPKNSRFIFSLALAPEVWNPRMGDGVTFDVTISGDNQINASLYSIYLDPKNLPADRQWVETEINLDPWADQMVIINLCTSAGPNNNNDFDWAGWGEPRIVLPTYYSFLDHYADSRTDSMNTEFGKSSINQQTINYDSRDILFQHPSSRVTYTVDLPAQSSLYFGLGMAEEVWSADKGDGVVYSIYVRDPDKDYVLHRVFQKTLDPKNNPEDRQWFDEKVDLSRFGGKTVEIVFEAMPGLANDFNFDWGGWSNPVIIDETSP